MKGDLHECGQTFPTNRKLNLIRLLQFSNIIHMYHKNQNYLSAIY